MIKVIKNSYPETAGVSHAKPGDICRWELIRGCYWLVRESDNKSLFGTSKIDKQGNLFSANRPPVLCGIIAQVKSKGWTLEVESIDE